MCTLRSDNHSGPEPGPLSEAECMAAISTCFTGTEKRLATEGVHV